MSQNTNSFEKLAVRQLEEQKFALDQAAIVAQTDASGKITYVNDKFCEISGYSKEELIGKTHKIVNSGIHDSEFFKTMWKTIISGQIWRGEVCNRAKSGKPYWVSTTIVPFLDHTGRPNQYLAIRQDITNLKMAEKLIADQQAQLVASSKLSAIGEMAATITHEINNPLGVILGRCEMMKSMLSKGNLEVEKLNRLVDAIDVTAKRIEKIVKSMKTLSHEGQEEPFEKTLIHTIIDSLYDLFSEKYRTHGIQLTINPYDRNLIVECRSHEILQVLVNLLNNSFDAISSKENKWVRIDVEKIENKIQISVMDCGNGIADQVLEKLFMPFFSTKKVQFGTGLGLSISRSLIQRHFGSLEYDRQSPFTRFVITLPVSSGKNENT